jgi:FkbM family methyltransferase
MNRLRRLAAMAPLRVITLRPGIRRRIAAVFSLRFVFAVRSIDQPMAFLMAEARRAGTKVYRLRRAPMLLVIRHDQGGLELLYELFVARCYEPPADLAPFIPRCPQVVDAGANVGLFTAFALSRWPGALVTAIEPDRDNLRALRAFVDLNAATSVRVVPAAASTSDEQVRFSSGAGAGSRLSDDGELVDAIDFIPLLTTADFVKLDIEGGEWQILGDPRLTRTLESRDGPLVLVMEYHRRFPGDKAALSETTKLLTDAGFKVGPVTPNYWGHGTLWAWREA